MREGQSPSMDPAKIGRIRTIRQLKRRYIRLFKKGIALCLAVCLVCGTVVASAQEESSNRVVSEKLIVEIERNVIHSSFRFSPEMKRVAYVCEEDKRFLIIVDGKEQGLYDYIWDAIFSPNSKRLAYAALAGSKRFVVVDGKEEEKYDGIGKGTIIFSPDSKRVAYTGQLGTKWFLNVDGKRQGPYDGIWKSIFSPDGKRLAYEIKVGDAWCVVVDGKREGPYDGIGTLIFSPDSKRLVYAAKTGDKYSVVMDGTKRGSYDGIGEGINYMRLPEFSLVKDCFKASVNVPVVFDSSDKLRYIAQKGSGIYLVEERIEWR